MSSETPIIVTPNPASGQCNGWTPCIGQETIDFLENVVPAGSQENVCDAAVSILAKGISPQEANGQETGLVIGYVQSGKTMSFEVVTALARDNSFQIVILIAGVSIPLLEQSTERLRVDLGLDSRDRTRRWIQFQNPSPNDDTMIYAVRDALADWRDTGTPDEYKKTILITVLKHHQRLRNLTSVFDALSIQDVPVLIIDDEADQASLNNEIAQGLESTTYRRLMDLRNTLPCHTYLQYTATPQAPLLISIIDSLSPNFVQVLEPGPDYVGGQEFFTDEPTFVRVIPPHDVPRPSNRLDGPPVSLLEALRVFMVGLTIGLRASSDTGNRSMLVHPSHRTAQHQEFYNWVRDIFEEWKRVLDLSDDDPDKRDLYEEFRTAYDDLTLTTSKKLPSFEELIPWMPRAFRRTRVLEVNTRTGPTPSVGWRDTYGWILVGGQAMDRGFTIEGLTVTYMPRGIGVGNVDTIQQRARFFGYKRPYMGFCRLYLEQGTLEAFRRYVDHEENMRNQLKLIQEENKPLNEWKRAFVLDSALRPCRNQVLEFDYLRGRFADQWVYPRVVYSPEDVVHSNRNTVDGFLNELNFSSDEGHPSRTQVQLHDVCRDVSLEDVVNRLIVPTRITGTTDSKHYIAILLILSNALESNPLESCTVYNISHGLARKRSINENGEVSELFQGAAPVKPRERRGEVYPGDRACRDETNVTVQIHTLDLFDDEKNQVIGNVPIIAVWIPSRIGSGWLVQDQPNPN